MVVGVGVKFSSGLLTSCRSVGGAGGAGGGSNGRAGEKLRNSFVFAGDFCVRVGEVTGARDGGACAASSVGDSTIGGVADPALCRY